MNKGTDVARFARAARSLGRYIFNEYAWTYGEPENRIACSKQELRRSRAKIGRRFGEVGQCCVWVLPDCLCGVRPILSGVYYPGADFAVFSKIYFAPNRKASKVAGKLLKSHDLGGGKTARRFRRRLDKPEVTFFSNGNVNVY